MPADLLKEFGLSFHPFTDRIAEKSNLDPACLYVHSDLAGFQPSETTYVFFGRRGSGKTTIRMQMQTAYGRYNAAQDAEKRRGFFMVDLCRPGHMTACLRSFQEAIGCSDENWDASFGESWTSADMVDCILAYTATRLVNELAAGTPQARTLLDKVRNQPKAARQVLLLAHLYAKTDSSTLAMLRYWLVPPRYSMQDAGVATAVVATVATGTLLAARDERVLSTLARPVDLLWEQADNMMPLMTRHPRVTLAVLALSGLGGIYYVQQQRVKRSLQRASLLTRSIRVQKQQPLPVIATLLDSLFPPQDRVETIRSLYIGISAHQKLDLLTSLVQLLGYEALSIFGDCFDEVVLLDPVQYPNAIKVFAREVCRNDLLNFGRMHFFFPDSRLALDLNTDRTLKEARFDRHFVRDLTWSRHQLEELAQRRFEGAQRAARQIAESSAGLDTNADPSTASTVRFAELFKKVKLEDFSSYLSKLNTPRELMIMMTEMLARIEAHPDVGLTSQDMEIAVTKALEQAV